ncbi:envelope stress response membrane protein PspB [uncultured Erythrobacter sp.]|uniref:envelope stress response membrane protein PspB n=1 Tax=uncultured Erythrobacter sp. TaxID=263913 RepID=UPI002608F966|nr:envelope stress response membrane protein PspB [uncultured Erythrobacter sp.]
MPEEIMALMIVGMLFIGLPWVILHYVTKWKTAATITSDDEVLLEELYNLAKRLDERMDTVERLVATDDPSFTPVKRLQADQETDNQQLRELEQLVAERKGAQS